MPKGEKLLRIWDDWSAGVGYLRDDGRTPGMYYASGILGGLQDLRPAPFMNDSDLSSMTQETDLVMTYAFDENYSSTVSFLYAICNSVTGATNKAEIAKIQLDNTNFGVVTKTDTNVSLRVNDNLGQPIKYQGNWFVAGGTTIKKLTTIAAAGSNDTWNTNDAAATQIAALNHQMVKATTSQGVSILGEDEDPLDTTKWGSYFGSGDKSEAPSALFSISGLSFVLKKSGLYSFAEKNGRTVSGQIYEDFGRWRSSFNNLPSALWKGGAVLSLPPGLFFYAPGEPFTPIGVESKPELHGICPGGATEFEIGRYHGVTAIGDYLYTVYQPDPASTAALVLSGYSPGAFPTDITWQVLGGITLKSVVDAAVHGIYGAAQGFPDSASEMNPTVWFSDAANGNENLSYVILDSRGQPLRGRANTYKAVTSGDAFMSEMFFQNPVDLKTIMVYTDDMTDGDEWQISVIVNDTGNDINVGAPIIGSGRHSRLFERHNVYRIMLHVKWVATSTSKRAAPTIQRIEMWGNPRD